MFDDPPDRVAAYKARKDLINRKKQREITASNQVNCRYTRSRHDAVAFETHCDLGRNDFGGFKIGGAFVLLILTGLRDRTYVQGTGGSSGEIFKASLQSETPWRSP